LFFFLQAEDGIRDLTVTGVQTCALPISRQISAYSPFDRPLRLQDQAPRPVADQQAQRPVEGRVGADLAGDLADLTVGRQLVSREIGRASCRGRQEMRVGAVVCQIAM